MDEYYKALGLHALCFIGPLLVSHLLADHLLSVELKFVLITCSNYMLLIIIIFKIETLVFTGQFTVQWDVNKYAFTAHVRI